MLRAHSKLLWAKGAEELIEMIVLHLLLMMILLFSILLFSYAHARGRIHFAVVQIIIYIRHLLRRLCVAPKQTLRRACLGHTDVDCSTEFVSLNDE